MTIDELLMLGRDCYAAFNQTAPAPSARAWAMWAEMCAVVPVQAVQAIRSRIIEGDVMPRNFGKAVFAGFREWQASSGYTPGVKALCTNCDRETPGFFTVYWRNGGGFLESALVRCPCNHDPAWGRMESFDKREADRRGYQFTIHGQSRARFERELLGITESESGNLGFDRVARTMPGIKARKRHLDYVAEMEAF